MNPNTDELNKLIVMPSSQTAQIGEGHIAPGQKFCAIVENTIFGQEAAA